MNATSFRLKVSGRRVTAGHFFLMIMNFMVLFASPLSGKPDYRGMVDEIGVFLDSALQHYRSGEFKQAKSKAQSAYFEVFENLEGPIRINVSARKNYELESEFVEIRKMIVRREPPASVEQRVAALLKELDEVIVELEGGFVLVAEPETAPPPEPVEPVTQPIAPMWLKVLIVIDSHLRDALDAYRLGDVAGATELVLMAQFDGYKNTLLETAVRRYVSQRKDFENNALFTQLIGMMRKGESDENIKSKIEDLLENLRVDLPGLPPFEGVMPQKMQNQELPERDWNLVSAAIFSALEKALLLHEKGQTGEGVSLIQDTYFDVFEASGMEGKIGARDAGFKAQLERHFSLIIGQMKKGVAPEQIGETLAVMKKDFGKAAAMLSGDADSPFALFFYSLMIILREGFEAILIITAIIAYLVKTNHQDKLRIIYNACVAALVLSVLTAILVKWVFQVSAASQEILEGATMLLAAVVLFSLSYWLISKAETEKWLAYIKNKTDQSLTSGSMKALWFTAFLAVYREGAETVLFYQALVTNTTAAGITAIVAGFVSGAVLLVLVYLIMKYGSVRLPIRPFFMATGGLLYYMAFVFAGQGVMELIEGKALEPSLLSWGVTVPFLGIYPYWQTLLPQTLILLAAGAGLVIIMKPKSAAAS